MRRGRMGRGAFTLIELLVVCGIIALLAAILLPALGRAREVAKSVACMSNLHSIGLALHTYVAAYGDYYPVDYQYNNGEGESPTLGDGTTGGYFHWTAAMEPDQYTSSVFYAAQNAAMGTSFGPYPMQEPSYVCPSHVPHGFAPTNFTTIRIPSPPPGQTSETPAGATYSAVDDRQAPRLSYVANEAVMPRKKYCQSHDNVMLAYYATAGAADCTFANYDNSTYDSAWNNTSNLCQVQEDEITSPATTILVAEFSQNPSCIYGHSQGGGNAYKSHRPVNAVKIASALEVAGNYPNMHGPIVNGAPTPIDTDYRLFDGEEYDTNLKWQFYKLTVTDAMNDINAVTSTPQVQAASTLDHITYIDPNALLTGSNYLFVDGHAAQYTLSATLDPNNYLWGSNMWSVVNKPVIQNATADNPAIPTGTVVPTYQ